jgi:hypothetical protein
MGTTIQSTRFRTELLDILDETFVRHHGIYLDSGTSLFETLDGISAETASRPVGTACATIGAQVAHVVFFLDVLERYLMTGDSGANDWGEIWRTVAEVTTADWDRLRTDLRLVHARIVGILEALDDWDSDVPIGGALSIVVHTAYHLGEIRQALCTVG